MVTLTERELHGSLNLNSQQRTEAITAIKEARRLHAKTVSGEIKPPEPAPTQFFEQPDPSEPIIPGRSTWTRQEGKGPRRVVGLSTRERIIQQAVDMAEAEKAARKKQGNQGAQEEEGGRQAQSMEELANEAARRSIIEGLFRLEHLKQVYSDTADERKRLQQWGTAAMPPRPPAPDDPHSWNNEPWPRDEGIDDKGEEGGQGGHKTVSVYGSPNVGSKVDGGAAEEKMMDSPLSPPRSSIQDLLDKGDELLQRATGSPSPDGSSPSSPYQHLYDDVIDSTLKHSQQHGPESFFDETPMMTTLMEEKDDAEEPETTLHNNNLSRRGRQEGGRDPNAPGGTIPLVSVSPARLEGWIRSVEPRPPMNYGTKDPSSVRQVLAQGSSTRVKHTLKSQSMTKTLMDKYGLHSAGMSEGRVKHYDASPAPPPPPPPMNQVLLSDAHSDAWIPPLHHPQKQPKKTSGAPLRLQPDTNWIDPNLTSLAKRVVDQARAAPRPPFTLKLQEPEYLLPGHPSTISPEGKMTKAKALTMARGHHEGSRGMSNLHWAAVQGETGPMVERRLGETSGQVDARNDMGETALHKTAENRDPSSLAMMQHLLALGANPGAQDRHGSTVIMHVLTKSWPSKESLAKIELLIESGADPRTVDKRGNNALHKAMEYGLTSQSRDINRPRKHPPHRPAVKNTTVRPSSFIDIEALYAMTDRLLAQKGPKTEPGSLTLLIKLLVDHGLDINAKNNQGQTPLHIACLRSLRYEQDEHEFHDSSGIGALLFSGADSSPVDERGLSPLDYLLIDKAKTTSSATAELDEINHFRRATSSAYKSKMGAVKRHQSIKTSNWAIDLLRSYGAKTALDMTAKTTPAMIATSSNTKHDPMVGKESNGHLADAKDSTSFRQPDDQKGEGRDMPRPFMSEDEAARKIQAAARGRMARTRVKSIKAERKVSASKADEEKEEEVSSRGPRSLRRWEAFKKREPTADEGEGETEENKNKEAKAL